MFCFDLYYRQLRYCLTFGLFLLGSCLGFLLADSSDHLKEVILILPAPSGISRGKIAVEVCHEYVWREPLKETMHSQKLVAREKILESPHKITQHLLYMLLLAPLTIYVSPAEESLW